MEACLRVVVRIANQNERGRTGAEAGSVEAGDAEVVGGREPPLLVGPE